jgi:hypothetical protein
LGSAIYEEADTLGVPINKKEPNEVDEYGVDLGGR